MSKYVSLITSFNHLSLDLTLTVMKKMVKAVSNNDSRKLWSEVRKFKGKCNVVASSIDNVSDRGEIANIFSRKYKDLYNSVSFNSSVLSDIESNIATMCDECTYTYDIRVN